VNQTYITRDGDTLSSIAYAYYGYCTGMVEAILALPTNKGIAIYDVFPAGVTVILPPAAAQPPTTPTQLWQ
jgi:phage tail protein X